MRLEVVGEASVLQQMQQSPPPQQKPSVAPGAQLVDRGTGSMAAKGPPLSVEGTLSCLDSGPRSLARRTHCGGSVTSIAKRQEAAPGRGAGRVLKTGPGFPPMQQAATTQAVRSAEDALLDPAPGPAVADFRQESGLLFSLKHVVCRRSLGAVGLGRCPPPPPPPPLSTAPPRHPWLGRPVGAFFPPPGRFPPSGGRAFSGRGPSSRCSLCCHLGPSPWPQIEYRSREQEPLEALRS